MAWAHKIIQDELTTSGNRAVDGDEPNDYTGNKADFTGFMASVAKRFGSDKRWNFRWRGRSFTTDTGTEILTPIQLEEYEGMDRGFGRGGGGGRADRAASNASHQRRQDHTCARWGQRHHHGLRL